MPSLIDNEKDLSLLNRKLFGYPFTLVKLAQGVLKELQKPLTVRIIFKAFPLYFEKVTQEEIERELKFYQLCFPKNMIPYEKKESKDQKAKVEEKTKKAGTKSLGGGANEPESIFREIFLKESDIEETFCLINSKEMAKFIGIFAHLAYWLVFGHVNPIELDSASKKQIFVQLYEILMDFNSNTKVFFY